MAERIIAYIKNVHFSTLLAVTIITCAQAVNLLTDITSTSLGCNIHTNFAEILGNPQIQSVPTNRPVDVIVSCEGWFQDLINYRAPSQGWYQRGQPCSEYPYNLIEVRHGNHHPGI
jgi:hypothetical protein